MRQSTNVLVQLVSAVMAVVIMMLGSFDNETLFNAAFNLDFVPILMLGLIIILNLLEYLKKVYPVYSKPYFRSFLLLLILISVLISIRYGLDVINDILTILLLLYFGMVLVQFILMMRKEKKALNTPAEERKAKEQASKTLPAGVFSFSQQAVAYIIMLGVAVGLVLALLLLPGWFKLLGLLVGIIALIGGFILFAYLNNNRFKKFLSLFEQNLDYEAFDIAAKKYEANNLHEDTRNFLRIIRANYLSLIDRKQAMEYYSKYSTPINPINHRIIAEQIEIGFLNAMGKYDELLKKIPTLSKRYSKEKFGPQLIHFLQVEVLLYQLKVEGATDKDILINFPLNASSKLQSIFNSIPQAYYYQNIGNKDELKKIFDSFKEYKDKFPAYFKELSKICGVPE